MEIAFLITTCNRQESCQRLADSLQGLGDIYVINDGGQYVTSGTNINLLQYKRLGKMGYWHTVNTLFNLANSHKYYFMIPDDFLIRDSQIANAIEIWTDIQDPRKVCLNLFADRIGLKCWTNFKPIDKGNIWHTQWVDMCFLCEDKFFTALGKIPPLYLGWEKRRKPVSSGVGAYISRHLDSNGYNLYQVKESLVEPQESHYTSQMHHKPDKDENNRRYRYIKDTRRVV